MPTPIENAINTAWNSAFQAILGGQTNPNYIPAILAAYTNIPDLDNVQDTTAQINLCWSLTGSNCPQGNASLNFTGMTVTYNGMTNGTPVFSADDSTVQLPIDIVASTINGSYTANQSCGIVELWGCAGNFPFSESDTFTLILNTDVITLNCTINSGGGSVALTSVSFVNNGSNSVSFGNNGPSWLNWLNQLFLKEEGIDDGIVGQISTLMSNSELESSMQTAINQLLST